MFLFFHFTTVSSLNVFFSANLILGEETHPHTRIYICLCVYSAVSPTRHLESLMIFSLAQRQAIVLDFYYKCDNIRSLKVISDVKPSSVWDF